ncbi:MAG: transglycosylase SLT domain-containing protein [Geminicoccaceae bacterium]
MRALLVPRHTGRRLGVLLVTALSLTACVTTPPSNPDNLCDIFYEKDGWYEQAKRTEKRWGAPIHVNMAIMRHESAFRHDAKPPRYFFLGFIPWGYISSAEGYPQALDGTWARYQKENRRTAASRQDFDDSLDFIGWYLHTSKRQIGLSLGDAYSHYLAYHEGQNGFKRGTWKAKPSIQRYAQKVAATANRYQSQLSECRDGLENPGRWWWPF